MVDNLTKAQRSLTMSKIRGKWTGPEKKLHNYLKSRKVKHKMHPKIEGSPDVLLAENATAVFLHGCFWHKCPICYREPKSNEDYWLPKIDANAKRDKKNSAALRKAGLKVVVLWEHEIKKDFEKSLKKIGLKF